MALHDNAEYATILCPFNTNIEDNFLMPFSSSVVTFYTTLVISTVFSLQDVACTLQVIFSKKENHVYYTFFFM